MWEIAEALKLGYEVGSRASARLRLGSDPSPLAQMTMGGRTQGDNWGRRSDAEEDGFPPTTCGDDGGEMDSR